MEKPITTDIALSPHFKESEFRCKCQQDDCRAPKRPVQKLVDALEALRAEVKRPLVISSGIRCDYWNRFVGGAKDSAHLTAEAVDIRCDNSLDRDRLLDAIYGLRLFTGKGIGPDFVHVDVASRSVPVSWTYYSPKGSTQRA